MAKPTRHFVTLVVREGPKRRRPSWLTGREEPILCPSISGASPFDATPPGGDECSLEVNVTRSHKMAIGADSQSFQ